MNVKADKSYMCQASVFLFSACLLGLGTACIVCAGIGADALSTLALGMSVHVGLTVDILIFAIMYGMMAIAFFLDRKKVGFLSLIYPLFSTVVMRMSMQRLYPTNQIMVYMILLCGIVCMALAITVGSTVNICCNPYDALAFTVMQRLGCSYTVVRWMIDGSYLISGMLLGSTIGVVTLLILLLLGPCVDVCMKVYAYLYKTNC